MLGFADLDLVNIPSFEILFQFLVRQLSFCRLDNCKRIFARKSDEITGKKVKLSL
jgi:hypothetical protein